MQGIGKILKDSREARGITLDEVSEATKIRVKYLEAIEQEEFQLLPGEVYVKGFTTAYLKYLGIKDLPEVVEIMKSQREKPETSVLVQDEDVKEKTASSRSSRHATQPVQRRKAPRAAFEEKPLSKNSSLIIILSIVAIVLLLALCVCPSERVISVLFPSAVIRIQHWSVPLGLTSKISSCISRPSYTGAAGSGGVTGSWVSPLFCVSSPLLSCPLFCSSCSARDRL